MNWIFELGEMNYIHFDQMDHNFLFELTKFWVTYFKLGDAFLWENEGFHPFLRNYYELRENLSYAILSYAEFTVVVNL